jgi:transposase
MSRRGRPQQGFSSPHIAGQELHVFLDNLSAHKSAPVRGWLEHPKRSRWHLHFTPISASWLNLIEAWFSVLTRKPLTNTSFDIPTNSCAGSHLC